MDMLIEGRDGDMNLEKYGRIKRAADGTVSRETEDTDAARRAMQFVLHHALFIGINRPLVQPDDPDWFYALPLGLHGTLLWAAPTDWDAWWKIAEEKFGVKRPTNWRR